MVYEKKDILPEFQRQASFFTLTYLDWPTINLQKWKIKLLEYTNVHYPNKPYCIEPENSFFSIFLAEKTLKSQKISLGGFAPQTPHFENFNFNFFSGVGGNLGGGGSEAKNQISDALRICV